MYLRRMVEILSNEIPEARAVTREAVENAETRIGTRLDDVSGRVDRTVANVASMGNALWGQDGRGLRDAALGLAITVVGVALTAFGLPW